MKFIWNFKVVHHQRWQDCDERGRGSDEIPCWWCLRLDKGQFWAVKRQLSPQMTSRLEMLPPGLWVWSDVHWMIKLCLISLLSKMNSKVSNLIFTSTCHCFTTRTFHIKKRVCCRGPWSGNGFRKIECRTIWRVWISSECYVFHLSVCPPRAFSSHDRQKLSAWKSYPRLKIKSVKWSRK